MCVWRIAAVERRGMWAEGGSSTNDFPITYIRRGLGAGRGTAGADMRARQAGTHPAGTSRRLPLPSCAAPVGCPGRFAPPTASPPRRLAAVDVSLLHARLRFALPTSAAPHLSTQHRQRAQPRPPSRVPRPTPLTPPDDRRWFAHGQHWTTNVRCPSKQQAFERETSELFLVRRSPTHPRQANRVVRVHTACGGAIPGDSLREPVRCTLQRAVKPSLHAAPYAPDFQ